jgi:hypothetical protein
MRLRLSSAKGRGTRTAAAAFLLALCLVPVRASLLDDEIRLSQDLQARLQAALDHVLGERKATALVNVQLDFTPETRARLEQAVSGVSRAVVPEPARWLLPTPEPPSGKDSLPGFPAAAARERPAAPTIISVNAAPAAPPVDTAALMAAGVRIKRLVIRVLLDKSLPASAEETVRTVVPHAAGLETGRGDVFVIERVRMPTMLEEVFRNPSFFTPLVQKAATLAVVLLVLLCVFVLGLLALATMRRSVDRLIGALRTLRPVSGDGSFPGAPDASMALPGNPLDVKALPSPGAGIAAPGSFLFDVPVDKVGYLMEFLANEELENVALVVQHLAPASKSAFLGLLSPDQASALVVAMSQVSVVSPETLQRLQQEVERHIKGSSGGVPAVVEMLHASNPDMRRQLLDAIAAKDPVLGKAVRERIFFFEDLGKLSREDLSKVISTVQLHDLAVALLKVPPELKATVKTVLPELSWKMLEEEFEHRGRTASPEKVWEAQDRVVRNVYRLVREGHVAPEFFRLPSYVKV